MDEATINSCVESLEVSTAAVARDQSATSYADSIILPNGARLL